MIFFSDSEFELKKKVIWKITLVLFFGVEVLAYYRQNWIIYRVYLSRIYYRLTKC